MANIILPEILLLKAYQAGLAYIRDNYKANSSDMSKSYLALLLGYTQGIERYNLYEQAQKVFLANTKDPRHLDVNLFFNASRAPIPTIHITNPSELATHDALMISEGFQETIFDEEEQTYTPVFNRRFKSKYSIVLTSDNTNEIVLMYAVIRSLTISMIEHLELSGLQNIKISGTEISLKSDIIPTNIFIKAIGLEFEYDVPAIKLSTIDYSLGEFIPNGTILPIK